MISITNHAHARMNPLPPRGTRIQKNRFHRTNFCKFRDQQTINMLSKYGTTNVITRQKLNGTNIEQNGTFKIVW